MTEASQKETADMIRDALTRAHTLPDQLHSQTIANDPYYAMTENEAYIALLEDALVQSHHTISFLHGCLTDPTNYKYGYPEQTTKRLQKIKELVTVKEGCYHSHTEPGCEICEYQHDKRLRHQKALLIRESRQKANEHKQTKADNVKN